MQTIRLLVDFGLVVLIWMTQLIVYPGFRYYTADGLIEWHGRYTMAISVIVAPMMIAQVLLHGWGLSITPNLLNWFSSFLIILIWVNTFVFAVPQHNLITAEVDVPEAARKLVNINWYRTIMWSIVFFVSLYQTYKSWM